MTRGARFLPVPAARISREQWTFGSSASGRTMRHCDSTLLFVLKKIDLPLPRLPDRYCTDALFVSTDPHDRLRSALEWLIDWKSYCAITRKCLLPRLHIVDRTTESQPLGPRYKLPLYIWFHKVPLYHYRDIIIRRKTSARASSH